MTTRTVFPLFITQAKLSAVNPLCTDMGFEHKYGLEECDSICHHPPMNATITDPAHPDGCKDMPLKFTLLDGKTGEPIQVIIIIIIVLIIIIMIINHQGARVNVTSSSVSLSRKTNLEGKTTFPVDEHDNYTISITAEGYNPHTDVFPLDWCREDDCSCDLQKKVDLLFI